MAFDVTNAGDVRGEEVLQVYVGAGPSLAGVQQAVKALRGFERIALSPGETRRVTMTLARRSFEYWSVAENAWVTNAGSRTIWVGASSADLRLARTTGTPADIGGTVHSTLALTLGPAASFGAFRPGEARDYTATMTAGVTSSAGDTTLSVADATGVASGHLVNGSFALAQALQARVSTGAFAAVGSWSSPLNLLTYVEPVSSGAVTIEFKQPIAATDPLRTGRYGKTLTFSLSTTAP